MPAYFFYIFNMKLTKYLELKNLKFTIHKDTDLQENAFNL